MSFDDFAITVPHRLTTNSFVQFYMMFLYEKIKSFAVPSRGSGINGFSIRRMAGRDAGANSGCRT
jgi:hypothetical protein